MKVMGCKEEVCKLRVSLFIQYFALLSKHAIELLSPTHRNPRDSFQRPLCANACYGLMCPIQDCPTQD